MKIMGIGISIKNAHLLQASLPCIIVENHQQALDIFVIFYCSIPKRLTAIGKHTILWIPFFGWICFLCGVFFINRSNHTKAMKTMEKVKRKLQQDKVSLFIMPEGTRSQAKTLGPFKQGAFRIAIETQMKVQPIVISPYVGEINLNCLHAGEITVEMLPAIETKGKTSEDIAALTEETHQLMSEALKKMALSQSGSSA